MNSSFTQEHKNLLKLPTCEVLKLLGGINNQSMRKTALEAFTTLSLEQRKELEKGGKFSFSELVNGIVLFKNEALAKATLLSIFKAYPNWSEEFCFTKTKPLHLSIHFKRLDLFDLLIKHGANPKESSEGKTLIDVAFSSCISLNHRYQQAIMDAVLETKAFDSEAKKRNHILNMACKYGLLGVVRSLVKHDPSLSLLMDDTPLNTVCHTLWHLDEGKANLCTDILKALFEIKDFEKVLNLYWKGKSHSSPLHPAAYVGNLETMQMLIDKGAMIDCSSLTLQNIETPLLSACFGGQYDAICLLLKHGANIKAKDAKGRSALHFLANFVPDTSINGNSYDNEETIKKCVDVLLENGAIIDDRDYKGKTPIDVAQEHENSYMVSYLLNKTLGKAIEPVFQKETKEETFSKKPQKTHKM